MTHRKHSSLQWPDLDFSLYG